MEYRTALTLIALLAAVALAAPAAYAGECIISGAAWSGTVKVSGTVVVEEGATLVIEPGTTVLVEPAEEGEEGIAASGILVKGSIRAEGEPGRPITFTSSAYRPEPGDWGELQILGSPYSVLRNCVFTYAGWGVHVHDSTLLVESCRFSHNEFGGIRGRGDGTVIRGSDISGMDIGIRFWKGAPTITGNRISGNATGIFLRQDCEGARVESNDLSGNAEYGLKLGDNHAGDVKASGNWWGTTDASAIEDMIFDRRREPYIGRVLFEPVLEGPPAGMEDASPENIEGD